MRNNERRLGTVSRDNPRPAPPAASTNSGMVYEVPTEFVELPSRGLFYPDGHPLHNQETIEIKLMTAKEEDVLASTALIKKGIVLDRLLENILVPDIDPRDLLIGDRAAIMIAARVSSYGRIYETEVVCPQCSTKNSLLFDFANMKYVDRCFDERFMKDNSIEIDSETKLFIVELPITKAKVGLRLLDSHGEKELNDVAAKNEDSKITTLLSAFVESVNGSFDRLEIEVFIQNIPAKDSKYIRNIYSTLVPNVEIKDEFLCSLCSYQKEMEVPLSADFFWPR